MPISITPNFTPSPLRNHPNPNLNPSLSFTPKNPTHFSLSLNPPRRPLLKAFSTNSEATTKFSGGGDIGGNNGGGGGGGGDGDSNYGNEGNDDKNKRKNKEEALIALSEAGRSLESMPMDLKTAIEDGRIPASIVLRYLDLEKSNFFSWLMKFGGFKERLLADADGLFLAKVAMECGVGIFTKTAAEYERRSENFFKELDIVITDVVMAIIADFMLVYLPAPTVSLRSPVALNAGRLARFFHNCPDNAFQVALSGTSISLLQRIGAIARNGAKLFAVGTTSSLVGTVVTNALINARKAVDLSAADEVENVPILSTSVAYGVYMAVSSNIRYQVVAGVIEQRILEPLLHQHKFLLGAICFAVRTGNMFLGSLLWVDYARFIGIQNPSCLMGSVLPVFKESLMASKKPWALSPVAQSCPNVSTQLVKNGQVLYRIDLALLISLSIERFKLNGNLQYYWKSM